MLQIRHQSNVRSHIPGNQVTRLCPLGLLASGLLILALFTGCGPDPIRVYRAPKEVSTKVAWELPTGWREQAPGAMRVASFVIQSEGDKKAEVAIIPLPLIEGRDTEFVNLWRDQLKLKPVTTEELPTLTQPVQVGEEKGQIFDLEGAGSEDGTTPPMRIVAATLNKGASTWFIKMSGDSALVGGEKHKFIAFLQSLKLPAAPPPTGGMRGNDHDHSHESPEEHAAHSHGTSEGGNSGLPAWQIPASWTAQQPGPMLLARFGFERGDEKGTVTVSALQGDGGGMHANVNRWLTKDLGLTPIQESDLSKHVTELNLGSSKASIVDLTNDKTRVIVIMQSHQGQMWYYKLLAPDKLAVEQKENLVSFVKSVRYEGN